MLSRFLIAGLAWLTPAIADASDFGAPGEELHRGPRAELRLFESYLLEDETLSDPTGPGGREPTLLVYPHLAITEKVVRGEDRGGSWFVQSLSSYYQSYRGGQGEIIEKRYGIGYDVKDWLSLGADVGFAGLKANRTDGGGSGFDLFLRWSFVRFDRWSLGYEQKLGMLFTDRDLPSGGTRANFSESAGILLAYEMESGNSLSFNFGYHHLSNASFFGGRSGNPGFDSLGLSFIYAVRI